MFGLNNFKTAWLKILVILISLMLGFAWTIISYIIIVSMTGLIKGIILPKYLIIFQNIILLPIIVTAMSSNLYNSWVYINLLNVKTPIEVFSIFVLPTIVGAVIIYVIILITTKVLIKITGKL